MAGQRKDIPGTQDVGSEDEVYAQGCGGEKHDDRRCAVCERRNFPEKLLSKTSSASDRYSFSSGLKANGISIGFSLFALFLGLACGYFGIQGGTEEYSPIVFFIGAVPWLIGGLIGTYNTLFTREATLVDCRKRAVVHSERALLQKERFGSPYPFSEIACVCLDHFSDRTWSDGTLVSDELRANVYLRMNDGRVLSFGSGDPDLARGVAEKLHNSIGVPLEVTEPHQSPTSDTWDNTSD